MLPHITITQPEMYVQLSTLDTNICCMWELSRSNQLGAIESARANPSIRSYEIRRSKSGEEFFQVDLEPASAPELASTLQGPPAPNRLPTGMHEMLSNPDYKGAGRQKHSDSESSDSSDSSDVELDPSEDEEPTTPVCKV
jgi:hypothetical protein